MKKIIFVMKNLTNGGAERSLVNLLNEISDKYEISLFLFEKKGDFLKLLPKNIDIIDTNFIMKGFYEKPSLLKLHHYIFYIYKLVIRVILYIFVRDVNDRYYYRWKIFYSPFISKLTDKYDIACSYIGGEPSYYVSDKIEASKKYVWVHNDYSKTQCSKKGDLEYFEKYDKIITISSSCLSILNDYLPQFSNKTLFIQNLSPIKNIIKQANEFYPEEFNFEGIKIISIGRLVLQKNFSLAVKTAKRLCELNVTFKWLIMGEGELKKEIEAEIKKYHLENNVILLGKQINPYPYIKNADFFVQTSIYEGKSVVIDEAKILGTTIISTKYPTVFDNINNNDGIVVEFDEVEISNKIVELFNCKVKNKELKDNININDDDYYISVKQYLMLFEE